MFTLDSDRLTMTSELTKKQQRVLDAVREFQSQNGFPPTVRELATMFGQSSTAGIHRILTILRDKGHLIKDDRKSRSLGIVNQGELTADRIRSLPILGQVQAGMPQLAYEEKEGDMLIDSQWVGYSDSFLLRVRGLSMIDADIRDGDILVVQKTQQCRNGDIVIALLDDEATVKRIYREHDRIRLQPENQTMQPIYVERDYPHFYIIGLVRGLLRKF
ncbi:transcriptional repressor LexA [candidate division KSB1 bacterium]|nr:transcriptional repressor LexA [candidate division KSB1 bacterium]